MAFHNWRDALYVARGAAGATSIRRTVRRDPVTLVWVVREVGA